MNIYKHTVQYYETDRMGITHHSNYIRWMEEARVDFFDKLGLSYQRIEEDGIISPVTAISCKYKNNTTFSDVVEIKVSVSEFRGVVLKLEYEMKKQDGSLAFLGHSEHCFMNSEGKLISLKKEYPKYDAILQAQLSQPV